MHVHGIVAIKHTLSIFPHCTTRDGREHVLVVGAGEDADDGCVLWVVVAELEVVLRPAPAAPVVGPAKTQSIKKTGARTRHFP